MEFERKRFFSQKMNEGEKREYGFPAIERLERFYFPALEKTKPKYWKKVEQLRKKAQEFRYKFFPVTPNDFFPIEGMVFELALTDRLLRNERYQEGRRLRVDFHPRDIARLEKTKARSKDPRKVHQDQNFLDQAMEIVSDCSNILLVEYARQISVDKESREFEAWGESLEKLANNFSAALFQGVRNDKLHGIIDGRKGEIIQKRKAMLGLATFSK